MASIPAHVSALAAQLAGLPGAVAVALGGSRATGAHRPDSDWDLGVYYRSSVRALDPADVRRLGHPGHVAALGEWGPIVNGGAWLTVEETPVDVLYRDLDAVEGWLEDARAGRFAVLAQNGYLAGAPTYLPVGELALCRSLAGELPRPSFPPALATAAPPVWEARASLALTFAHQHARREDVVACTGMLALAVLSAAHARLAGRGQWVLNEKRLVERAGLGELQALVARADASAVAAALGIAPLALR